MADKAFASQGFAEPRTAEAWAIGLMLPPFRGSAGVSASAWSISYDQWRTPVEHVAKASREANRNQWYAGVKAIAGVVEDIPPGSTVLIYVVEKEFERLFPAKWRKANRKPASGFEVAAEFYADINHKQLDVRVEYRPADDHAAEVQQAARAEASKRYASLSDQQLIAAPSFKRTKPENRSRRGFPAVRDDEPSY